MSPECDEDVRSRSNNPEDGESSSDPFTALVVDGQHSLKKKKR
jgi:hypothetical protein